MRQLDGKTMVSGQIQPEDVPQLKHAGVTMIVCNRPDGEEEGQPTAAQIEDAATAAGIAFRHVPIVRGIGPADAEAMQEAIAGTDRKLLAYCRSGTRSTLLWALARREQGASIEDLHEAAARAGFDLTPIAHLL